jgi:acyl-coenzyme A synthetase/AMP-(fatty) acid ligase
VLALLSLECIVVPIETGFIRSINNFFDNFKFKLVLTDSIYNIAFEKYKDNIQTVSRIDISNLNIIQSSKLAYKNITCSGESPALALFSTGSTGVPKIVLIPQKTIFFFGRPDHTV